jgi:hypothetical protein
VGGLLGGTLLVVILSATFQDWSYVAKWAAGLAAVGLVAAYQLGKHWLMRRAIRLDQQDDDSTQGGGDA